MTMKVYDVIKTAEEIYLGEIHSHNVVGMCWSLKMAVTKGMDFKEKNRKEYPSYRDLVTNIPEFNPEFLKATSFIANPGLDFWWDIYNHKSRLDAFSVLKDIYKESIREFEY